ncbi:MAG: U32 family peptidase [Bacilli bacterium]|nr:U32 family peptidase [Bacilli bacterium]
MNRVELLAPAGDLERLKWACLYGADAIYLGGENYSLRSNAKNFTLDEIKEGVEYAHKRNVKVYVTVNIVFHENDDEKLIDYLKKLEEYEVDAIIASDMFILDLIKDNNINLEFHLSTQSSCLNKEAVKFFQKEGVKRVVLARECSKNDIKNIIDETGIDTEVFIHGAMCMAYSGRCTLSNYLTNRDSNRGACAQICRWTFDIYDKDKKINKETDFSFSPKDLSLLKQIPELIDIGVKSFKIEGRMKSIYYVATLLSVYRRVIDNYYSGNYKYNEKDDIEVKRCANRETTPQYFDKFPGKDEQYYIGRQENTNQDFLGVVLEYDEENKEIVLEQRNYFEKGDIVNIFGPKKESFNIKVDYIKNEDGDLVDAARHPQEILRIPCDKKVEKYDIIRIDFLD